MTISKVSATLVGTLDVLVAWDAFKASHNIDDTKISCCDKTRNLFKTLDNLSALMQEAVKELSQ